MTDNITPVRTKKELEDALGFLAPKPAETTAAARERERRLKVLERETQKYAEALRSLGLADAQNAEAATVAVEELKNLYDAARTAIASIADAKLTGAPEKKTRAPRGSRSKPPVGPSGGSDAVAAQPTPPAGPGVAQNVPEVNEPGAEPQPEVPAETDEEIRERVQAKQAQRTPPTRPSYDPNNEDAPAPVNTDEGF